MHRKQKVTKTGRADRHTEATSTMHAFKLLHESAILYLSEAAKWMLVI